MICAIFLVFRNRSRKEKVCKIVSLLQDRLKKDRLQITSNDNTEPFPPNFSSIFSVTAFKDGKKLQNHCRMMGIRRVFPQKYLVSRWQQLIHSKEGRSEIILSVMLTGESHCDSPRSNGKRKWNLAETTMYVQLYNRAVNQLFLSYAAIIKKTHFFSLLLLMNVSISVSCSWSMLIELHWHRKAVVYRKSWFGTEFGVDFQILVLEYDRASLLHGYMIFFFLTGRHWKMKVSGYRFQFWQSRK